MSAGHHTEIAFFFFSHFIFFKELDGDRLSILGQGLCFFFKGKKGFLLLLRGLPRLYSSRLRGKTRTPQPSIYVESLLQNSQNMSESSI
jgi:hypothetical protein